MKNVKKNVVIFFAGFIFKLLSKLSDFINSDDWIGKITSKSVRLEPVFIRKKISKLIKKQIFACEKMMNLNDFEVPRNCSN